jgi:hypothetical protein
MFETLGERTLALAQQARLADPIMVATSRCSCLCSNQFLDVASMPAFASSGTLGLRTRSVRRGA